MTQYRGGAGNFAADKERAAEAGRKGGQKAAATSRTILNVPLKRGAREVRLAAGAERL